MDNQFINRECSMLEFNSRVLERARNHQLPILERLRYLCISSGNMDEFFEVRIALLKEMDKTSGLLTVPDQMPPAKVLENLYKKTHRLISEQYEVLNDIIIPELDKNDIHISHRDEWNEEQKQWAERFFKENLAPVLSPVGVDPAHPFPQVANSALHFLITLKGQDAFGRTIKNAVLQVPRSLPRVIEIPEDIRQYKYNFAFLSTIIHAHIDKIFPGMKVTGCFQFRLTRNTNLFLDEETTRDLLPTIQDELHTRSYGDEVRLEIVDQAPDNAIDFLLEQFNLNENDLYRVNGPVNLYRLSSIVDLVQDYTLKFKPFRQKLPSVLYACGARQKKQSMTGSIFNCIKQAKQILLHHPYHSFFPVLELLRQSAKDSNVLAIRMTLYRTGASSPIVDHLELASRSGKEVTVIVELKARFDEDDNISVAKRLQRAGAKVVYGVMDHKTHAKMLLVVRKERNKLKYYHHMGTGNYHNVTAKIYTDIGILSNDKAIGKDIYKIFQQLTSLVSTKGLEKLLQSPFTLKKGIINKINREIEHAKNDKPARIIGKMNGLQESDVINALYEASKAGVKIDLIVRGICCLRPGVKGLSENITVRSIIGRFLEHPRIYYFHNDGDNELWCSSADLMHRNLNRRIETAFPVENIDIKKRIVEEALNYFLQDNSEAWLLNSDSTYTHLQPKNNEKLFSAQQTLINKYR